MFTRRGFNIVGFHGVSLEDEHERFPTLFISAESFERRLRFLLKHYQIVSLQEALEQHHGRHIRPYQVVLTFDDGFYNFLSRAMPILKRYDAPATVYVVTAEVESGAPAFNLLVKDIILSTPHMKANGIPERNAFVGEALTSLNTCRSTQERFEYCYELGRRLDVDVESKIQARLWDRLTAAEVRCVAANGFDVQLHTHNHRNVVENHEVVRSEVHQNRRSLEPLTGKPAIHFCYPLGLWERRVWPDLTAEGVVSAVTTRNGPNYPNTPTLSLRRYLTGEAMNDQEFEFALSGIRWFARALLNPGVKYHPSEKRARYQDQPELF